MYNLSIKTWWIISLVFLIQYYGESQKVIQDVILIDIQPFEVRMTEDGNIIDTLKYLPDYFKEYETRKEKKQNAREPLFIAAQGNEPKVQDTPIPEVKVNIKELVSIAETADFQVQTDFPDQYNVFFDQGKATLTYEGIAVLDQLAAHLLSQPQISVIAITFFYEPVTIAQLLSQRRRDACVSYLKIKGVNVDEQVVKGSISQSQVNKVYFGLKSR
ncbi:MAG TPA: hypothetical protein PLU49_07560 [Saprospiraceae bacterium]|nr:hypothetical protein [Saprospirales bacterium]HRQ29916.1 hypothetical protein [Saprospiraceae bacterium]